MKRILFLPFLVLNFLVFGCSTQKEVAQKKTANDCNFQFNVQVERNESVPLIDRDSSSLETYTQTAHKLLQLMLTIDQSLPKRSRVKFIDQVMINYDALFSEIQVAELNAKFKGKWIANDKLNTSFSDWIYTLKLSNDSINKPYIYERPTIDSRRKLIPPDDIITDKSSIEKQISVIRCKGQWVNAIVKVNGKEYKGWLPYYNLCHNKVTSCHHVPESGVENAVAQ